MSFYTDGIDVVAGPGSDADALASDWFSGAVTGRYAGRITKARFMLDGEEVRLVPNVGEDQLHGGPQDFCNAMWKSAYIDNGIRFTLHSPDGDQGFPGAMEVSATYRLIDTALSLDLEATTTK
ncbi:MAG TPA: galactose mutarotase, partial [Aestuariivirga sp.]|nr:galactose mutarotase [Aestuariivirga sp.]